MSTASISVVIPVYNAELYLAEAVQSILAQTLPVAEIILVDDGSTDGSAAVAQKFAPPVRLLSQPNAGAGAARNRGVQTAQGDLIAFLDADDLWTPDKLARQTQALAEGQADMIFGAVQQFYSPELDAQARERIHFDAKPIQAYSAGTLLLSRASFLAVGAFAEQLRTGEFIDWYLRATHRGLSAVILPEVLLQRRLHMTNSGIVNRAGRSDYAQVIKAALERRRAGGKPDADENT